MQKESELEEQCEDAVFEICCVRERYSARCGNQLEKYLHMKTKLLTSDIQKNPVPTFTVPVLTEEQEKLFVKSLAKKTQQFKSEEQSISSRIKDLKSITSQIERSKNSEFNKLLE